MSEERIDSDRHVAEAVFSRSHQGSVIAAAEALAEGVAYIRSPHQRHGLLIARATAPLHADAFAVAEREGRTVEVAICEDSNFIDACRCSCPLNPTRALLAESDIASWGFWAHSRRSSPDWRFEQVWFADDHHEQLALAAALEDEARAAVYAAIGEDDPWFEREGLLAALEQGAIRATAEFVRELGQAVGGRRSVGPRARLSSLALRLAI